MYSAIVGLSFGKGRANKYLAEVIEKIKKDHNIPVILQWEISEYYHGLADNVIVNHRTPNKYLDTFEVLAQAGIILGKQSTKPSIILVAHPLHFPRAWKIAEKLGFAVAEGFVPMSIPCDPKDAQWWCRNKFLFALWEVGAWIKFLIK